MSDSRPFANRLFTVAKRPGSRDSYASFVVAVARLFAALAAASVLSVL